MSDCYSIPATGRAYNSPSVIVILILISSYSYSCILVLCLKVGYFDFVKNILNEAGPCVSLLTKTVFLCVLLCYITYLPQMPFLVVTNQIHEIGLPVTSRSFSVSVKLKHINCTSMMLYVDCMEVLTFSCYPCILRLRYSRREAESS